MSFQAFIRVMLLVLVLIAAGCGPLWPAAGRSISNAGKPWHGRDPYAERHDPCADQEEQLFLNALNDLRGRRDLTPLSCLHELRDAAEAHLRYLAMNDKLIASGVPDLGLEVQGQPGFSGANAVARGQAAGLTKSVLNTFWLGEAASRYKSPPDFLESAISSVYQRDLVLTPGALYAGMSQSPAIAKAQKPEQNSHSILMTLTAALDDQVSPVFEPKPDANVPAAFANHEFFPVVLPSSPKLGYPVSVHFPHYFLQNDRGGHEEASDLSVSSFELRTAAGQLVEAQILSHEQDPRIPAAAVFLVPIKPLAVASEYNVHAEITFGTMQIDQSWRFRTDADQAHP